LPGLLLPTLKYNRESAFNREQPRPEALAFAHGHFDLPQASNNLDQIKPVRSIKNHHGSRQDYNALDITLAGW